MQSTVMSTRVGLLNEDRLLTPSFRNSQNREVLRGILHSEFLGKPPFLGRAAIHL